jgi:hypothetical protein
MQGFQKEAGYRTQIDLMTCYFHVATYLHYNRGKDTFFSFLCSRCLAPEP